MIITHKLTMDLGRCGNPPMIDAVQDDRYTRNVELTLLDQGNAWTIPEGAKISVAYRKADNTGGHYDSLPGGESAWSARDNVLTLALAPQTLTAAGMVSLSARVVLEEREISTFRFLVNVQRNVAAGLFHSEDYVNLQQWCLPIFRQKLDSGGWEANRFLGTDALGNVVAREASELLPAVTGEDDGKFLRVRGGVWTAEALSYAEEEEF